MISIIDRDVLKALDDVARASLDDEPLKPETIIIDATDAPRLAFLTDPNGLAVEQYKMLRRRLRMAHPPGGLIMITSPGPGEGKTLTSMNLAWSLADAGYNTCLVDLDFRAPGLARAMGLTGDYGIEPALSGRSTLSQSGVKVADVPLHVYAVKHRLESPAKYFSPSLLTPFMSSLRSSFEWVILDLVPAVPMSDVSEILPYVDGALMVVRAATTSAALLPASLDALGPKLRGVVLNDARIQGSAYYGDYGKHNR